MSDGSLIGWLGQPGYKPKTANVVIGCTRRSEGCDLCYAPFWVARQQHLPGRDGIVAKDETGRLGWTGKVIMIRKNVDAMMHHREPRMVFVTALGELFDTQVTDEFLRHLWIVMAATPQHIYVILTKLPKRMHDKVSALAKEFGVLPNVWLGVSVENQRQAENRIHWLLRTPAAIRAVSCEPLIAPVNLRDVISPGGRYIDALTGTVRAADGKHLSTTGALDWVIVGGETGTKNDARGMHPDWARALIHQAIATNTAVYFKQWGSWAPAPWIVRVPDEVLDDPARLEAAKQDALKIGATHYLPYWAHLYDMKPTPIGHPCYGGERKPLEPGSPQAPLRYFTGKTAGCIIAGRTWHQWPNLDGPIIDASTIHQEALSHA